MSYGWTKGKAVKSMFESLDLTDIDLSDIAVSRGSDGKWSAVGTTASEGPVEVFSYTSDFTADADGFILYSVEGTGSLTFNETLTVDSSTGWLKLVVDADQTSSAGIVNPNLIEGSGIAVGDTVNITADVYADGEFDGTDPLNLVTQLTGSVQNSSDIPLSAVSTGVSLVNNYTIAENTSIFNFLRIYTQSNDNMAATDALWIKNIQITVTRG